MGAWEVGSFDNDDALDWVYELEEADDLSILSDAFEAVLEEDGNYLDEVDCAVAIGAAEVVAGLMGNSDGALPDEVRAWIKTQPKPSGPLVADGLKSLRAILKDSGLKDLWEETEYYDDWKGGVLDLIARMSES